MNEENLRSPLRYNSPNLIVAGWSDIGSVLFISSIECALALYLFLGK